MYLTVLVSTFIFLPDWIGRLRTAIFFALTYRVFGA